MTNKRKAPDVSIFRTIVEQSPVSTQIFSPDGETIYVNKAWEELWGIKFSEFGGYNILQDKQLVEKQIMQYIKKGFAGNMTQIPAIKYEPETSIPGESTVAFKWVKAVIYPIKDSTGKIQEVILQHEDITEQKEYEERIISHQERLELAQEAGNIGAYERNMRTGFVMWTPQLEQLYGYEKGSLANNYKAWAKHVHPDDLARIEKEIKEATRNHKTVDIEFRIIRKDKKTRWIAAKAKTIYDEGGEPVKHIGVNMDITERKNLETRKDEFISMASHELKTPVTSLKVFTQTMQRQLRKNNDSRYESYLEKMEGQIDKLSRLISDLLDVSKINTGKFALQKETFYIDDLVHEVAENLRTIAKRKIVIKNGVKVTITGDKVRLSQVIVNLINNAFKYSPKDKEVTVIITPAGEKVRVSVVDQGKGISKEYQDKIFERFYQVPEATQQTYPGLGLGLYISHEIVKMHKGKIEVQSEADKGATFSFILPTKA